MQIFVMSVTGKVFAGRLLVEGRIQFHFSDLREDPNRLVQFGKGLRRQAARACITLFGIFPDLREDPHWKIFAGKPLNDGRIQGSRSLSGSRGAQETGVEIFAGKLLDDNSSFRFTCGSMRSLRALSDLREVRHWIDLRRQAAQRQSHSV